MIIEWILAAVVCVWLWVLLAISSDRSNETKASYTGVVTSLGTTTTYGTWGGMTSSYVVIATNDHSDGLNEVYVHGTWVIRTFEVGDRVEKTADERRPRVQK